MANDSLFAIAARRFFRDPIAIAGIIGVLLLLIPALYAPFIANGRPFLMVTEKGEILLPFLRTFFAPDSTEYFIEQLFNYFALYLPLYFAGALLPKGRRVFRVTTALLLLLPFFLVAPRMDKKDYRIEAQQARFALFAPVPYGPFEMTAEPFERPSKKHWLGCDDVGRSVLSDRKSTLNSSHAT